MNIRKTKSLDEIYEEAKGYDLVLTVQGPLADALNGRLDRSKLGFFAITPRRMVHNEYSEGDLAGERELFLKVIRETELSWKQAFYLLENIIDCWQKTGDLKGILGHEDFNSLETREVLSVIEEVPNVFSEMQNFELGEDLSVGVVGLYQFDELDRKVLPENFDEIDVFEEGNEGLPEFSIFGTTNALIEAINRNVTEDNFHDVAIVTPSESEYEPLIQSLFDSRDIPYMSRVCFSETENLRTFLSFLELALSDDSLKLKDVRPILTKFGIEISFGNNEEFLKDSGAEGLDEFKEAIEEVEGSSFEEAMSVFERFTREQDEIREEFERLRILEEEVSEESINRLEYYLDSFDITVDSKNAGVLFASPKSAPFIDRSVIFYLGMDSSWVQSPSERPWIDNDDFNSRRLKNFQLLLQNGQKRYYMVRNDFMGSTINPCLYLNEVIDEEFESFSDFPNEEYWKNEEIGGNCFEKDDMDVGIETEKVVSQSSLNSLVQSPKQYFFSKLVTQEEKSYLKKGILFHDFAEFYVNHPEFVEDEGIETFVEIMIEEINPLVEDYTLDKLKVEFRLGIENILEYLDWRGYEQTELEGYGRRDSKNIFSQKFQKELDNPITEAWFENSDIGAKGKVDLIKSPDQLVDYKSGRKNSQRSIVKNSNVDLFEDDPNFQAILYLTHHRKVQPDSKLRFTFYHFMENIEEKISGASDLEDNIVTIDYYPRRFEEQLMREETFDDIIGDVAESNDRRKTLESLGFENYCRFLRDYEIPQTYERDELLGSEFANDFIEFSKKSVGEYKYVKKGCQSALKKMMRFRKENYFKEDLDKFEEFLDEQIGNLNRYKEEGFPVGDADIEDLDNQDLILGDDFGT